MEVERYRENGVDVVVTVDETGPQSGFLEWLAQDLVREWLRKRESAENGEAGTAPKRIQRKRLERLREAAGATVE